MEGFYHNAKAQNNFKPCLVNALLGVKQILVDPHYEQLLWFTMRIMLQEVHYKQPFYIF